MTIKPGIILISSPVLDDPNFDKVVIYICEYNDKGAMGFVINHIFPRAFNELTEFKTSRTFPLFDGGPVENEKLFFLHRRPDIIEGGTKTTNGIYLGGNFEQAVTHINYYSQPENDIKLFVGYCGWDPRQLETEIEEGSWLMVNAAVENIFTIETAMLWEELYVKQ
ncbi:YqgE/AlgH family protein [Ferruginibacter sp.]|nr:YqgE/AlgH family protein [Ferruginibacter sp.]